MELPKEAEYIITALQNAGFEAYAVGGCVRDSVMGRQPADWDICTAALPSAVETVFKGDRIIETGLKHGTVTLVLNRTPYEITTFRTEGDYKDFRRPETVSFVTDILKDLSRRDFTINAMAYSPQSGIVDPFGGINDIKSKTLRCVGDPFKRFSEDALRILRALRFASVLGFELEAKTAKAIITQKSLLKKISAERISVEFTKLLDGKKREEIMTDFAPVFEEILPQPFCVDFVTAAKKAARAQNSLVAKAVLLHFLYADCKKVRLAMRALKSDNRSTSFAADFSRFFDLSLPKNLAETRKNVKLAGFELYREICVFKQDFKTLAFLDEIEQKKLACKISDLDINGNDLLKIGITGKALGVVLERLLEDVMLDNTVNQKEQLILHTKKIIQSGDMK